MRIITEPTVKVVWRPEFIGDPERPIPKDGGTATKIGAYAAKTCYRSFGEDGRPNEKNQERIIASGHGRILEHMVYGLAIRGVSRALGNEFITHKSGITVSQESTRYVDQKDAGYVLEPDLACIYNRAQDPNVDIPTLDRLTLDHHLAAARAALDDYALQVEYWLKKESGKETETEHRKWARGKARNVLPLGLETAFVATGNLRAWRHFIEMRSDRYAEAEIRRLSNVIFEVLSSEAPLYFQDYEARYPEGSEILEYTTPYRKV